MKNKKGFTLIELLAVIVVLAIIALIATPIVMNTIKNAKKGSAERGADNYIKQVETTIAEKRLENNPLLDGTYTIDENGNLTGNGLTEPVTIEMNGTKPSSGSIIISEGRVTNDSIIGFKDYEVKYNTANKKYEATAKGDTPQVEVLCKSNTTKVSALVWDGNNDRGEESSYVSQEVGLLASESGAYTPGVTYTCELGDNEEKMFFVLEENGDNVSLIMDKNIDSNGKGVISGNAIVWVSKEDYLAAGGTESDWNIECTDCGNNNLGPITAEKYLKNSTTLWTKLNQSQISLPSASQVATASGKTFDASSTSSISGLSTWLYGNFINKVPIGYWTSTPSASDSDHAWGVDSSGSIGCGATLDNSFIFGVRPVITISKSQLG